MIDRVRFRLSKGARRAVHEALDRAPEGYVAEIREETRTDQQNRLLWPLLEDVSRQVRWHGRTIAPADWKNGFMMALAQSEFVPGINPGTVWPLGLSTSVLGKAKFSELIELVYSFGAENGVKFRTDKETTLQQASGGGRLTPERADEAVQGAGSSARNDLEID